MLVVCIANESEGEGEGEGGVKENAQVSGRMVCPKSGFGRGTGRLAREQGKIQCPILFALNHKGVRRAIGEDRELATVMKGMSKCLSCHRDFPEVELKCFFFFFLSILFPERNRPFPPFQLLGH